jgi:hypothetical protein
MSEQMRKDFEKWHGELPNDLKEDACSYAAYKGWQASRQSLVVKLPCWSEYDSPRQYMDAMQERLSTAGVRYE